MDNKEKIHLLEICTDYISDVIENKEQIVNSLGSAEEHRFIVNKTNEEN